MSYLVLNNLTKRYGPTAAVDGLNLEIKQGEFVSLLGPSGCGKTTTLRMIAGLELPTTGEILLGGNNVTFNRASERDIAFVFQLFALYPHMNVRENIGFPLKCDGVARDEIRRRVEETAQILRITELLNKPVSSLSGGDRQRVALGRAIVRKPLAFLMDERSVRLTPNSAMSCAVNCARFIIASKQPRFTLPMISLKPCRWPTRLR